MAEEAAVAEEGGAAGGELAMNPFADVHVHPAPDAYPIDVARVEVITVRCPVRGRGLLIRELTRTRDPALFAAFADLVARGGELELDSDAPIVEQLVEIGFLIAPDEVVDWPPFSVPLGEPAAMIDAAGPWVVEPTFRFQPAFALHPELRWPSDYDEQEGRFRCFAPGPACWVGAPDALVGARWLTDAEAAEVSRLRAGEPPPPLPEPLVRALVAAGVLVPATGARPSPLDRFAHHRAAFAADGFAVVPDLVGAAELEALRRYYAALVAAELVPFGDRQCAARFSSYDDPIGRFVHARLAPAMAAVAGVPVDPSFSYFFSYVEGAALAPHKDRPEAELSISLQLDHHPRPAGATGWPLRFTFDDGRAAAADLAIGDAVLFHGRALTHHRDALAAGQRSSVLVLEYVPHDFRGLRI